MIDKEKIDKTITILLEERYVINMDEDLKQLEEKIKKALSVLTGIEKKRFIYMI